jgi:hypothetical protein
MRDWRASALDSENAPAQSRRVNPGEKQFSVNLRASNGKSPHAGRNGLQTNRGCWQDVEAAGFLILAPAQTLAFS